MCKRDKTLYVVTGAFDCGKTSTLKYLHEYYGVGIHGEAPADVIKSLGERVKGHSLKEKLMPVKQLNHFCPVCNPEEFAGMVLDRQAEIEADAEDGDFLERGYIDPVEFYLRLTGRAIFPGNIDKSRFISYSHVFILEVMPELQVGKWGKDEEERIREAVGINNNLCRLYSQEGFDITLIKPGTIEERANCIIQTLWTIGKVKFSKNE